MQILSAGFPEPFAFDKQGYKRDLNIR